jgi:hypothetical protein
MGCRQLDGLPPLPPHAASRRLNAHATPAPRRPPQVIVSLAERGDMSALMAYTGQSGTSLNYIQLLQQLMMTNPSGAVSLAKMAAKQVPPPAGCDTNSIADLFLQRNMVREATAFLLDALAGERERAPRGAARAGAGGGAPAANLPRPAGGARLLGHAGRRLYHYARRAGLPPPLH